MKSIGAVEGEADDELESAEDSTGDSRSARLRRAIQARCVRGEVEEEKAEAEKSYWIEYRDVGAESEETGKMRAEEEESYWIEYRDVEV